MVSIKIRKFGYGDARLDSGAIEGHQTCDLQVAGSSPGWAPLHSSLRHATYTCVPLSPNSIIWYWPRRVDHFGWESKCGSGGK